MAQSVLMQLALDIKSFRQAWEQAAGAAQQGAQKVARSAQTSGRAMEQAGKKATGFAGAMDFLKKRVLGAGLFFAAFYQGLITLRQFIGSAVSELFDLDDALRRVQSITKESDEAIARLKDQLVGLAKQGKLFDQSAADVAASMFNIAQAGFASADALTLARLAAEGAAVGFTKADTSAQVLVGVLKAYNLPVSKARDVMDVLFQTVDTGMISFENLANGLGKVLSSASALDVPLTEVGAAIATMTLRGFTGAQAMTSLGRMMQTFIRPSTRAKDLAHEYGIELSAATIQSKGFIGTLQEMFVAVDGDITKFAALFDQMQATRGATSLFSDDGKLLTAVMIEMGFATEGAGAMARAMEERAKSLKFQLGVLRSQALAVVVDALEPLMQGLAGVLGDMNNILGGRNAFFNFFADTEALVMALVVAFLYLKRESVYGLFMSISHGLENMAHKLRTNAANLGLFTGAMRGLGAVLSTLAPMLVFMAAFSLVRLAKSWDDTDKPAKALQARLGIVTDALNEMRDAVDDGRMTMAQFDTNVMNATLHGMTDVINKEAAPALDKLIGMPNMLEKSGWKRTFSGVFNTFKQGFGLFGEVNDAERSLNEFHDTAKAGLEDLRTQFDLSGADLEQFAEQFHQLAMNAKTDEEKLLFLEARDAARELASEINPIEELVREAVRQSDLLGLSFGESEATVGELRDAIKKWAAPLEEVLGLMEDILGLTSDEDLILRDRIAPVQTRIELREAAIAALKEQQIARGNDLVALGVDLDDVQGDVYNTLSDQIAALERENELDAAHITTLRETNDVQKAMNEEIAARYGLNQLDKTLNEEQKGLFAEMIGELEKGPAAFQSWIALQHESGRVLDEEVLSVVQTILGDMKEGATLKVAVDDALAEISRVDAYLKAIFQQTYAGMTPDQVLRLQGGGRQHGIRNWVGGLMRVGEAGEELVRLPRGSDVIPNGGISPALRQQAQQAPSMSANAEVNITTSLLKDFLELKKSVLQAVSEQLDTAAARAGLAKPRLGTLGAGIPRT